MATEDDTTSVQDQPAPPWQGHEPKNAGTEFCQRFHAEQENPVDFAMERLHQAWALTSTLYGEGFESFSRYHPEIQQNMLWALHSLIDDARVALWRA